MGDKRPVDSGFSLGDVIKKRSRLDQAVASSGGGGHLGGDRNHKTPYLSTPIQPEKSLQMFLTQVRNSARNYLPKESRNFPIQTPFCEVEVRLGLLKVPHASPERRVTSSGAKHAPNGAVVKGFDCTRHKCLMQSGVSRLHFLKWTNMGISEPGPLSQSLGVSTGSGSQGSSSGAAAQLKKDLVETEYVETVYTGYQNDGRVCFVGEHPTTKPVIGKLESKEKLLTMDLAVPAAPYDIRVNLSSEKVMDPAVQQNPPPGWKSKRVKKRRSYMCRDRNRFAWQVDVTEVVCTTNTFHAQSESPAKVEHEIEAELREHYLLQLINEEDPTRVQKLTTQLAQQLWWLLSNINPIADALEVEESLREHPDRGAVQVALAHCGALKKFMDAHKSNVGGGSTAATVAAMYKSPILHRESLASLSNVNFVGCMPVNFSRHNLEEIQQSPDNAYFLSEKTDGIRHFLIFTGDTAVLVDRAMKGKQPKPVGSVADPNADPFAPILDLIQPGTVLDGEVVMNRRPKGKPRPIFIVFDVLATSPTNPVLHLPFEQRLYHLRQASFRTKTASRDMFDPGLVANLNVALPLVRKNFVKRTGVDDLLSHVSEERGMRCYRNGDLHNHLTDGIIFQPNRPYVCGTDVKLLKWKYLDTVTIDVEVLPLRNNDDDDVLRVGCMGEEQTTVDMTRYVLLPQSERMKLEADKFESGGRIAEVGFDPETGEWYYLTMRSDKIAPNHISTVLGTLLELAESLNADELRYRMSIPSGQRDTYRKDMNGMLRQLMDHQRRRLQASRPNASAQPR